MTSLSDATIEAGVDAYGRMLGNYTIQEIVSEIYLAMKAKDEASPADRAKRDIANLARVLHDSDREIDAQFQSPSNQSHADEVERIRRGVEDLRDQDNFPAHLLGAVDDLLEYIAALSAIKGQQSTADEVEKVIEILWSMADTDGSPGDMRRCAERIVSAIRNGDEGMKP